MALAEEDEVAQALVFDGSDEALRVGIAFWALGRNLDAFAPLIVNVVFGPKNRLEVSGEERVGVMNEMTCVALRCAGSRLQDLWDYVLLASSKLHPDRRESPRYGPLSSRA